MTTCRGRLLLRSVVLPRCDATGRCGAFLLPFSAADDPAVPVADGKNAVNFSAADRSERDSCFLDLRVDDAPCSLMLIFGCAARLEFSF
jgi:hypothetical protein